MTTVARLLEVAEDLWPASLAEEWDTPGLQIGSRRSEITGILLAVDVTPQVIDEAVARNCSVIFSHHPMLLRGVTAIDEQTDRGYIVASALRNGISVVSAHTNADVVANGVSDLLANRLELRNLRPLVPTADPRVGLGRAGDLLEPVTLDTLVETLKRVVPTTKAGIRVVGSPAALVQRVALCAGAGDSFLSHPEVLDSDVYITSDLRHHPALDAKVRAERGQGPWLVDVSHWASESLWLAKAQADLASALSGVDVIVSQLSTDPWDWQTGNA